MELGAALKAGKYGFDLVKGLRESLRRGEIDHLEISNRLMELQELLLEMQSAVSDSKDREQTLEQKVRDAEERYEKLRQKREDYTFKDNVYFHKDGSGPYCPTCLDGDQKAVNLIRGGDNIVRCAVHKQSYGTAGKSYIPPNIGF